MTRRDLAAQSELRALRGLVEDIWRPTSPPPEPPPPRESPVWVREEYRSAQELFDPVAVLMSDPLIAVLVPVPLLFEKCLEALEWRPSVLEVNRRMASPKALASLEASRVKLFKTALRVLTNLITLAMRLWREQHRRTRCAAGR